MRFLLPFFAAASGAVLSPCALAEPTLREVYEKDFLVGVALNMWVVNGRMAPAAELAARQFSSVTSENDMKWQMIQPEPGRYRFAAAENRANGRTA